MSVSAWRNEKQRKDRGEREAGRGGEQKRAACQGPGDASQGRCFQFSRRTTTTTRKTDLKDVSACVVAAASWGAGVSLCEGEWNNWEWILVVLNHSRHSSGLSGNFHAAFTNILNFEPIMWCSIGTEQHENGCGWQGTEERIRRWGSLRGRQSQPCRQERKKKRSMKWLEQDFSSSSSSLSTHEPYISMGWAVIR